MRHQLLRVMYGPAELVVRDLEELMVVDNSDTLYDAVDPWQDIGATKTSPQFYYGRVKFRVSGTPYTPIYCSLVFLEKCDTTIDMTLYPKVIRMNRKMSGVGDKVTILLEYKIFGTPIKLNFHINESI